MDKLDFFRESWSVSKIAIFPILELGLNISNRSVGKLSYHGNSRFRILSRNADSKPERPGKKRQWGSLHSFGINSGFIRSHRSSHLEADRRFRLRMQDRESKLIRKIEQSLSRIDEGIFGICEACGEDIAIKRLKAKPVTTYCIACKNKMEAIEQVAGA